MAVLKIAGMIAKIFISSSAETIRKQFDKVLQERGINFNHPDLFFFPAGEKLGIEQARKIKQYLATKPYQAKGKVVIIEDGSKMTTEAQNALLKTLEELPEETVILIGTNSDANLLPTVLSRCQIVRLVTLSKDQSQDRYVQDISEMLGWDMDKRFRYIEKVKEREMFLEVLVKTFRNFLYEIGDRSPANLLTEKQVIEFIEKLTEAEIWEKQNVNIRAILEYLMLEMPYLEATEKEG